LDEASLPEKAKNCADSVRRRPQRPASTQKAGIGVGLDFAGTTKSTAKVRSWRHRDDLAGLDE
jgi:hypothetical protein